MIRIGIAVAVAVSGVASQAAADCPSELAKLGVIFSAASRKGIEYGVSVTGTLGGVRYVGSADDPLVIDCSLARSLAEAGPYFTALGITDAHYSSAYSRRNVRGTNRPSKHSYGRAIDIHRFSGPDVGSVRIDQDFEQGLGDAMDCIGAPLTEGGAVLKVAQCQLIHSGLFSLVLSPDYDDAHHDHFHLEALPWGERAGIRAAKPAVF
jgi:hypothetical protein